MSAGPWGGGIALHACGGASDVVGPARYFTPRLRTTIYFKKRGFETR